MRAAGSDQLREDPDRVRRAQRVDVIEHEQPVAADRVERRGMGAQRRRQPREVDARGDRAGRGRVQLLVLRGPWRSELPEGVGEPLEQDLGVVVERCQREPRDRTALALDPVGEQRRLPVAGGGSQKDDRRLTGTLQTPQQTRARHVAGRERRRQQRVLGRELGIEQGLEGFGGG